MTRTPDSRPPAYPRQHTAADPANVVTETEVPNERKALPSQKGPALMLAFAGAAVALIAVLCEWMDLDLVALILAILAVVMTGISVAMARNDARAGMGAPVLCLIAAAVVLFVVLMDVFEVDEEIQETQQNIRQDTQERLDENRGDADVPADPADIVEGGATGGEQQTGGTPD